MSLIEQRTNVRFCVLLEKSPSETLSMLQKAYGDAAMKKSQVFEWHKRFREGRISADDDPRSGRPSTSINNENIERVRNVVRDDRRLSLEKIAAEVGISVGSCHSILHNELHMQRVTVCQQDLVKSPHYSNLTMPPKGAAAKGWGKKRKLEPDDVDGEDTCEPKPKLKVKASVAGSLAGIDFSALAKTKDGKVANLKIVSWNVNGLRAWLEKDGLSYIQAENPDVACIQELKCDVSKIPVAAKLAGYANFWLSGDKEGYSGVGLYYRTQPIKVTEGIGIQKHDEEGRVITAEFDQFFLVNTYIPNSGRGLPRLNYRTKEWDVDFRDYLKSLDKKKPVVWCGDLNVAHHEIDLRNPKGNKKTAGFTIEERESFTATLQAGFTDSFRYLYPHQENAYTFWTHMMNARAKNAGWRLDYFVVSDRLRESLCDNIIRSSVLGSDHCPIVLQLAL